MQGRGDEARKEVQTESWKYQMSNVANVQNYKSAMGWLEFGFSLKFDSMVVMDCTLIYLM